jgi:AcrR family transcriptional regulator
VSTGTRGPSGQRGVALERILSAARKSFALHGWAGTSMRSVAREAGVDSRLIGYYFADKTALLEACLVPPPGFVERIREAADSPLPERGATLVRTMLQSWETPAMATVLRSIILTAAHEPIALERLRGVFRDGIIGAVADSLPDDERVLRAGLVSSQMVGLAMTRYVWRVEPMASMPEQTVVDFLGHTVQRYLDGAPSPAGS